LGGVVSGHVLVLGILGRGTAVVVQLELVAPQPALARHVQRQTDCGTSHYRQHHNVHHLSRRAHRLVVWADMTTHAGLAHRVRAVDGAHQLGARDLSTSNTQACGAVVLPPVLSHRVSHVVHCTQLAVYSLRLIKT